MTSRSNNALASILLTSHVVQRSAEPLEPRAYWELHDLVEDFGSLLGLTAADVQRETGFSVEKSERIANLLEGPTELAFELEALDQRGISTLTPYDEDYPDRLLTRLGTAAPPVMYVSGRLSLLSSEGLGVVGSRDANDEAKEVARQAARAAAERGLTLISGGARGIDRESMKAAFESDGRVVGILADSLVQKLREPENRQAILDGQACLATVHKPSLGFTVGHAMARNKVIYALAQRTLVVSTQQDSGGTWAGATEALRRRFGTVTVWAGEGSGAANQELVGRGAGSVNAIDEIFTRWGEPELALSEEPAQMKLSL